MTAETISRKAKGRLNRAAQALPEGYVPVGQLALGQGVLGLGLQLAGASAFFFWGWAFFRLALAWRPAATLAALERFSPSGALLLFIAATAVMLPLHEGLHGLCFWAFTRARPVFALHWGYACAAAPGWYLPRNQHLVVGLAPLVGITGVGVGLLPWLPQAALLFWWWVLTLNAGGAVGDLLMGGWEVRYPSQARVEDRGDAIEIWVPLSPTLPT